MRRFHSLPSQVVITLTSMYHLYAGKKQYHFPTKGKKKKDGNCCSMEKSTNSWKPYKNDCFQTDGKW